MARLPLLSTTREQISLPTVMPLTRAIAAVEKGVAGSSFTQCRIGSAIRKVAMSAEKLRTAIVPRCCPFFFFGSQAQPVLGVGGTPEDQSRGTSSPSMTIKLLNDDDALEFNKAALPRTSLTVYYCDVGKPGA